MTALAPVSFISAYRQLRPTEKAYVDAYIAGLERDADRQGERLSNALYRPVDDAAIKASGGNLAKPMVRAAIVERINEITADSELSVRRLLKEFMSVGFSSVMDYMTIVEGGPDGLKGTPVFDLASATPEQLAAVQSIEFEETPRGGRKFKFKLHDKMAALDRLAKFTGMLDADNPHWRAIDTKPANAGQGALPAAVTDADAADAYSRMINDG